jgi:hypothetical protein
MSVRSKQTEPLYDPVSFPDQEEQETAPEPTPEELEDFKEQVRKWGKLSDEINKLNIAARERRVHQRALASKIQEFLVKHKYEDLNMQGTLIRCRVRDSKVPLKLQEVRNIILEQKELCGEELIAKIFESERPRVQKCSLRRVQQKVSLTI